MFITAGTFWIFFVATVALYHLLPVNVRWTVLLFASLAFYGYWEIGFLFLLLGHVAWVYLWTRFMDGLPAGGRRRAVAWIAAGGPLLTLLVFKYGRMALDAVGSLLRGSGSDPLFTSWKLLVPIGISFYTFKTISYVVEVYRRRIHAERNPGILALYVAFFPQVLAGPIDRPNDLIPQLRRPRRINPDDLSAGALRITWGLFKKLVVADRLAYFVGFVFDSPAYQGLNLLFAAYLFAFQIYCDFSGYSDIAIGLCRILGIDSAENFDRPYLSRGLSRFWASWHMTLSRWFRDYVFLPMTYAVMRRIRGEKLWGIKAETWGYGLSILLTMTLCGLWHGAAWNFVFWGSLYGLLLTVSVATRKLRRRLVRMTGLNGHPRLHAALSVFWTFNLVSLAWIFFRSASLDKAFLYLKYMKVKVNGLGFAHLVFDLILVAVFLILESLGRRWPDMPRLRKIPAPLKLAAAALFVCLIAILAVNAANEFIYVRF